MGNKKAMIELSTNFVVVLILGIVILGFGIYFIYNIVDKSEKFQENVGKDIDKRISELLDTGQNVVMPVTQQTIGKGKSESFYIGILNTLGQETTFTIKIEPNLYVKTDGNQGPAFDTWNADWADQKNVQYYLNVTIKNNDHASKQILVTVPKNALSGTYVFDAKVLNEATQYGSLQKFYVVVP